MEGKKILLVDDNPLLTDMYKVAFESFDLSIEVENEGTNVLERAVALQPDLILLDLRMPDILGGDVLRQLKSESATKDIDVVVFSSIDDKKAKQEAIDLGAIDYIVKSETEPLDVVKQIISTMSKNGHE